MREQLRIAAQFIDPCWLNAFRARRDPFRATKLAGEVVVGGESLRFPPDSTIPDGTEVEVSLDRYFYAEPVVDIEVRKAVHLAAEAAETVRHAAELRRRAGTAAAFNDALRIPVRWVPAIKDVLSGLTESSWGDGRNKRTVVHALLEEALDVGRLHRSAGDFLCTAAGGSNGKNWTGDGRVREGSAVTCQACLKLAARLRVLAR